MDDSMVRELVLWAQNTSELYGQYLSICKNLQRKYNKGIYDETLACKLWGYMADSAAKHYAKEFYPASAQWHKVFSMETRRAAAAELNHWVIFRSFV